VRARESIRFYRRIDSDWLDAIAASVAAGDDEATMRAKLFKLLDGVVAGGQKRNSACQKTLGVLSGVWFRVIPEMTEARDRAAVLLDAVDPKQRIAIHWALMLGAFPFFVDVAANSGRLLALQGDFSLSQLTRRMRETWGERSTLDRATQRVVRSMVQWGVLVDAERRGNYTNAPKRISVSGKLSQLLLEAMLVDQDGEAIPLGQAIQAAAVFPFEVEIAVSEIRRSNRFEIFRQGLDVDVVQLADKGSS
jgi:hypothetical protein